MKHSARRIRLELFVLLLLPLAVIALRQGNGARTGSLGYDHCLFAAWADNFIRPNPFVSPDHRITTGPLVLGFVPLAIAAFGREPWATSMAAIAAVWTSLLALILALWQELHEKMFVVMSLFLTTCLCLSPSVFWYQLYGEVPGALYLLAGVVLLFRSRTGRQLGIASLLIGISVQTKLMYLLAAGVVTGCVFVARRDLLTNWRRAFIYVFGLILPMALYTSIGAPFHGVSIGKLWSFFKASGGFAEASPSHFAMYTKMERFLILQSGYLIAVAALVVLWKTTRLLRSPPALLTREVRARQTSATILLAGFGLLAYWQFIEPYGWIRRAMPAMMCIGFGVSLWAGVALNWKIRLGCALGLILIGMTGQRQLSHDWLHLVTTPDAVLTNALATRSEILKRSGLNPEAVFTGCTSTGLGALCMFLPDEVRVENVATRSESAAVFNETYWIDYRKENDTDCSRSHRNRFPAVFSNDLFTIVRVS
jgi:hypothetical protein